MVKFAHKKHSDIKILSEWKVVTYGIFFSSWGWGLLWYAPCGNVPGGALFYVIGNSSNFLLHKKRSAGSHCGGVEKCRKGDPPQAENLACEILCSRRFLGNISSNTIFVQIAQKKLESFVNFVNTFGIHHGIIILVKTPQYIIYSFCYTP